MLRQATASCATFIATLAIASASDAGTILLNPIKDNTLISSATGDVSNALGPLFCGRTGSMGGNAPLRLVLAFDLTSNIPPGSTITAAQLRLQLEQGNGGDQTHDLHRLLRNWGEGTSDASGGSGAPATTGDATWLHTFYNTQTWTTPGGDFVVAVSASQTVGTLPGEYVWSSPQLIADLQAFVNRPACNFGWIMQGNETASNSAKRFYSRENVDVGLRPQLFINYSLPTNFCPADINHSGVTDVTDLLAVITNWGACPACPAACSADIAPAGTTDSQVNVSDLLKVITSWGPCAPYCGPDPDVVSACSVTAR